MYGNPIAGLIGNRLSIAGIRIDTFNQSISVIYLVLMKFTLEISWKPNQAQRDGGSERDRII